MGSMNSAAVAERWKKNLSAATAAMKEGVLAVTVSPTQKAAAKADKYLAGIQEAVSTGKWQAALQAVSLGSWQDKMINVGLPRVASGAAAAMPKMTAFLDALLPYTERVKQQVDQMPDQTPEDRKARMLRTFDLMSAFKYRARQS